MLVNMEEQHLDKEVPITHEAPHQPSHSEDDMLQPVGPTLAARAAQAVSQGSHGTPPKPAARSAPHPIRYPFIPYPLELADMERRQTLPPAQLRVLGLRRFAHPFTGEWVTTTREVARLIRSDRSTAQKALRALEQAHFLHLTHHYLGTVELVVWFGGFADPGYRKQGKPALHWDNGSTPGPTVQAQGRSQLGGSWHSYRNGYSPSTRPFSGDVVSGDGTVYKSSKYKENIRSREKLSTDGFPHVVPLIPVGTFVPGNRDEAVAQELARKLGEKYMNSFLSCLRVYGLERLERAYARTQDKRHDPSYPLKGQAGAYVRWLLHSGSC